ncbi:hypothetical protein C8J56DRAFT_1040005 [Mycena floridula]|nr:hypothetical protein C8J56DRAFT_1040005 [Mycena floridula]
MDINPIIPNVEAIPDSPASPVPSSPSSESDSSATQMGEESMAIPSTPPATKKDTFTLTDVMHYNPDIKPGFLKELPILTPETIALLDQAPAPKSLSYYIPEESAVAFFIYRTRTDQLYLGCEVYQNSNGQWCMNLRQVRGLLAAHGTAPIHAKENAHIRHKYFFIFAMMLGIRSKYAFYLKQLRLAHPRYQTIKYKPVPLQIAPGIKLTIPHVIKHMFNCGITIARADNGYNYGYISVSSGIPTGFLGDQVFIATHPVVPFPAQGVKPPKGKTTPKPSSTKTPKRNKSLGQIHSQVNNTATRLNAISFGNGVPTFIDRSSPPGFGGHVTYQPNSNFPSNRFNGQFTSPSGLVGPSVVSGAPSFPHPVDTVMGDASNSHSMMQFNDVIHEGTCKSNDNDAFADAH